MKPKCAHRFQITGAVTEDGKRVYSLCCPHCGKKATRKLKLPKPYDPSRSHRKAPGSTAAKKRNADKPRARIKPVSDAKSKWLKLYREAKDNAPAIVWCEMSGRPISKFEAEAHHPFGRLRERILAFVWLSSSSHRAIHDDGKEARRQGWLQPQYDGSKGKGAPRPWSREAEAEWPENLKRANV